MAELKTRKTGASVNAFLKTIGDAARRRDCQTLVRIMRNAVGAPPRMWGPAIVGFGDYRYRYASGREGDWFVAGFSPRKQDLTLYLMSGVERFPSILKRLGKYKIGKSCLYIKSLAEVDMAVLAELIAASVDHTKRPR
jgi:Domain of unknown function (DU1801)